MNWAEYVRSNKINAHIKFDESTKHFDIIDSRNNIEELTDDYDMYFIKAPMKLGKTNALLEFIESYYEPYERITIVSFRKTFTRSMSSRYNKKLANYNITNYQDHPGAINKSCIVQYESLNRIDMPNCTDLLVLDELESIFEQIFSTHGSESSDKNFHALL